MWRHHRRRLLLGALAASSFVAAVASGCSSFGGSPGGEGGDAATNDATQESTAAAPPPPSGNDGGDAGDAAASGCLVARAPTCVPGACTVTSLPIPKSAGTKYYVFSIAPSDAFIFALVHDDGGKADAGPVGDGAGLASIYRISRAGSGVDLIAKNLTNAFGLVIDGSYVYWAQNDPAPPHGGWLYRIVPTTGQLAEKVAPLATTTDPYAVLTGNGRGVLYYGSSVGVDVIDTTVTPAHATTPYTDNRDYPGLATDGEHVFFSSNGSQEVARLDPDGGVVAKAYGTGIADSLQMPLATDCVSLFATYNVDGGPLRKLWTAPIDGSAPSLTNVDPISSAMVADEAFLYWVEGDLRALDKRSAGAQPVTIAPPAGQPPPQARWAIAIDDVGVYWGDHSSDGAVYWMHK